MNGEFDWVNFGRAAFTLVSFISFVLVLLSAYSKKSKKRYDVEAKRVLEDDDTPHADDEPSHGVKQ
jgi:cytochrome c oxidase cbb3-type subunit 4